MTTSGPTLVVNCDGPETRVALIESGSLAELYVERKRELSVVGNIYKGRVARVLPGMQAAFVDVGLGKAGYLHVADVLPTGSYRFDVAPEPELVKRRTQKIQDLLRAGNEILVQVAKAPIGQKGARVTTELSLPGRHLVLLPTVEHVGVSRRIQAESERQRLRELVEAHRPEGMGLIVRTVAEGAAEDDLLSDLDYLVRLWSELGQRTQRQGAPVLIYQELDLMLRAVRDLLGDDVERMVIDQHAAYEQAVRFARAFSPAHEARIQWFDRDEPIFDAFGVETEIDRALSKKVFLKSGGSLVIDEGEALTAIDVNTGRFVGKRNLEETITKNNLEACREIAQQLRLRNLGGIVVVDFIDMEDPENRDKVRRRLQADLEGDKSRSKVGLVSELGLVEMTRKRTSPSLSHSLTEPCFYCEGNGYLKSRATVAYEILREVRRRAGEAKNDTLVVSCHPEVANTLVTEEFEYVEHLQERYGTRIAIQGEKAMHLEEYQVRRASSRPRVPLEADRDPVPDAGSEGGGDDGEVGR